jgi:dienelactone hydrolase
VTRHRISATVATLALAVFAAACSSTSSSTPTSSRAAAATLPPTTTSTVPPIVTMRRFAFVDTTRPTGTPGVAYYHPQRALPTDVYLPPVGGPRPLIVLAHGVDGAPRKFSLLLHAWANAGFVAAAPRFPATADAADGGVGWNGLNDYKQQPADVSFVITQLLRSDIADRIDASRIAVAGMSLGGGTIYGLIDNTCCVDPRIKAAAIFDGIRLPFSGTTEANRVPVLIMHGDHDPRVNYSTAVSSYASSAPPKWFVTLIGGLHSQAYEDAPSPFDAIVTRVTIDYWQRTLLGDAAAGSRLLRDATVPGLARVESAGG